MQNFLAPLKKYTETLCESVSVMDNVSPENLEILEPKLILSSIIFLCFCAFLGALTPYLVGYLYFDWIPFVTAEKLKLIISNSIYPDPNYHLEKNNENIFFGAATTTPLAFILLFFSLFARNAKENTWWLSAMALYGIGMANALAVIFLQGTTKINLIVPLMSLFLSQFLGIVLYKLIQMKKVTIERVPIYFGFFFPVWIVLTSVSGVRNFFGLSPQPIFQSSIDSLSFVLIFILTIMLVFTFESLQKHLNQPRPKWIKWRYAHVITFNTLAIFIFLLNSSNKSEK